MIAFVIVFTCAIMVMCIFPLAFLVMFWRPTPSPKPTEEYVYKWMSHKDLAGEEGSLCLVKCPVHTTEDT